MDSVYSDALSSSSTWSLQLWLVILRGELPVLVIELALTLGGRLVVSYFLTFYCNDSLAETLGLKCCSSLLKNYFLVSCDLSITRFDWKLERSRSSIAALESKYCIRLVFALSKARFPFESLRLMSAPNLFTRYSTMLKWPSYAAIIRAVHPYLSYTSTLAPKMCNSLTPWRKPT